MRGLRIPRSLRIKGERWRVRFVPDLSSMEDAAEDAIGDSCRVAREIRLEQHIPRLEQEETLVHEILHAIWPNKCRCLRCAACLAEEDIIESLDGPLRDIIASGALTRGDK